MQPVPVRRPRVWWWFLVPVLSLGFGACLGVFIGALRLRSRAQMAAAGFYVLTNAALFWAAWITPTGDHFGAAAPRGTLLGDAAYPFLAVNLVGGTIHTLVLQFLAARPVAPAADPEMAAAAHRAGLRARARRLAVTDPALAWQLRIGRPDVAGRRYDDGGLVDVNHVPADWIAHALRLPHRLADEIVATRHRRRGFRSADELVLYCPGMTSEVVAVIQDSVLFGPF